MRTYDADFAGWAEDTARAICEGRWSDIDRTALADEVESLGKQERQRIVSRLTVLLQHLLKERYQPNKASRSWDVTVRIQRYEAQKLLDESPSLQPALAGLTAQAYNGARLRAIRETGLADEIFPDTLPFTDAEIWGAPSEPRP